MLLAEARTDLAEDRTMLANERTFAGWLRTGFAAIGLGLGFIALFHAFSPAWLPRVIASGLIALGVLIFLAAERAACAVTAQLHPHRVKTFRARMLKVIAWFAVATAVPVLIAIWL
ncbi:MAG TPA: DUF202 domain-containing protein [Allosphingosinicella sp.]|nr:DUF202 domain-containing protein [Allosphingosinicella sp.]